MKKRNIAVKHSDDSYSFTKAYKLFIDFARELIKSEPNKIQQTKCQVLCFVYLTND